MSWSPTSSTGFGFQGYFCSTACTKSGHIIYSLQIAFAYWTSLAAWKIHEGEICSAPRLDAKISEAAWPVTSVSR
jgi:hypothetical protein